MAQWFESWFDTEYYHMLYNKRNDEEAEAFISGLFAALQLREGMKVADIACGKGRHSKTLNELGAANMIGEGAVMQIKVKQNPSLQEMQYNKIATPSVEINQ